MTTTAEPPLEESVSLGEARRWLRARRDDGAHCPLCRQFVKVYRRQITSTSARSLIRLYHARTPQGSFTHWGDLIGRQYADEAKLVHWGLVEEENVVREDGGRAGYWRITPAGVDWVEERSSVPRYALIYDSRFLGFEGGPWTVRDALGKRFDLQELMHP